VPIRARNWQDLTWARPCVTRGQSRGSHRSQLPLFSTPVTIIVLHSPITEEHQCFPSPSLSLTSFCMSLAQTTSVNDPIFFLLPSSSSLTTNPTPAALLERLLRRASSKQVLCLPKSGAIQPMVAVRPVPHAFFVYASSYFWFPARRLETRSIIWQSNHLSGCDLEKSP
jgi:hypothetical protein